MYGKSTALQVFSRKRMCWTWKALGKICVQFPSSLNGCVLEVSLLKRIICDQIEFSWINSTGNRKLRNDMFDNLPRLPYGPGASNLSHALSLLKPAHVRLFSFPPWSSATVCPRRQRHEAGDRLVRGRFSIGFWALPFFICSFLAWNSQPTRWQQFPQIGHASIFFIPSANKSKNLEYVESFRKYVA